MPVHRKKIQGLAWKNGMSPFNLFTDDVKYKNLKLYKSISKLWSDTFINIKYRTLPFVSHKRKF